MYLNLGAGYLACKGLTGIESFLMLYMPLGIQSIDDDDDDDDDEEEEEEEEDVDIDDDDGDNDDDASFGTAL